MPNGRIRLAVVAGVLAALTACHHGGSGSPPPSPVAASLAFAVQPGAAVAGSVLSPAVDVQVLDASGAPFTGPTSVTLAVSGGVSLRGTTTVVATGGHAVFADLVLERAATGYTLTASADGLPSATSAAFAVAPGAPAAAGSSLVASASSAAADGAPVALTATVGDAFGNPIAGQAVTLEATGAASVTQPQAATAADGKATGAVRAHAPGKVTVSASVGGAQLAHVDVTFTPVVVASIMVTGAGGATFLDGVGQTLQLAAAVAPASAAQAVTWSSSDPRIVSVDQGGLATARGAGRATISATATDGSGVSGTLVLTSATRTAIFARQANGTTTATVAGGTITASSSYTASGNAFAFQSGGFYGTSSNGFVALPFALTGDFSITATMTITSVVKAGSSTTGIGVGVTTGFDPTDRYAYALLQAGGAGSLRYVDAAAHVADLAASPAFSFTTGAAGTAVQVTLARTGDGYTATFGGGSKATVAASALTDGTRSFGAGAVYPVVSFNDVNATITGLVVKDGAGHTLFDSATGTLVTSGTLTLPSTPTVVTRGEPATTLSPPATAMGGAASRALSAAAADPTLLDVAVVGTTITLGFARAGVTTLTVNNLDDTCAATSARSIPVYVQEFSPSDGYAAGDLAGRLYPPQNAPAAYADGELSITFDAAPVLSTGGSIDLYRADGTRVDRIFFAAETQAVNGTPIYVGSQLARVDGSTVYFTPHFGALQYGTTYYVGVSTTAITGTLGGRAFKGFSNLSSVATWKFTTRPAPAFTGNATIKVDGASTGTADFRTVGGALMHLAQNPIPGATDVRIDVAAGTYVELAHYRPAVKDAKLTVTISGPAGNVRGAGTTIQYTNGGTWNPQPARASFYFAGANLVLENLTFRNTGVRATHAQAEALYFNGGAGTTLAANNCTFSSFQDTVQTTGRAWIHGSSIAGNTDFIWGTSDVTLVERCDLHVLNDKDGATYAIFVARTGKTGTSPVGKGYVLKDSTVAVDAGIVAAYGRNAGGSGFYDQVALVNNTFTGSGTLANGLWTTSTAPLKLGDATYVGWKAADNKGLGAETAAAASGTAATIASQATEYTTRDQILNDDVIFSGTTPTGFQPAATPFSSLPALRTRWGITTD